MPGISEKEMAPFPHSHPPYEVPEVLKVHSAAPIKDKKLMKASLRFHEHGTSFLVLGTTEVPICMLPSPARYAVFRELASKLA